MSGDQTERASGPKSAHVGQALFTGSRSATACLLDNDIAVVALNFMGGGATVLLNPADLRSFAAMLNEVVEHLPAEVSP